MGRIIIKKVPSSLASRRLYNYGRQSSMKQVYEFKEEETKPKQHIAEKENNTKTKVDNIEDTVMMTTNEKIELANTILNEKPQVKAKRIKADKGLIERKENSIILTEDNRELLND